MQDVKARPAREEKEKRRRRKRYGILGFHDIQNGSRLGYNFLDHRPQEGNAGVVSIVSGKRRVSADSKRKRSCIILVAC